MNVIVLFGAGTTGRVIARDLQHTGGHTLVFADNNPEKYKDLMEGIPVVSPTHAKEYWPDAKWVCAALQPKFRAEIQAEMRDLGVNVIETWEFMPRRYALPSITVWDSVVRLCADELSKDFLWDQYEFRTHQTPQISIAPMEEIYFPPFIQHLDDEHYVDCGAADGDTIAEFKKRWPTFRQITAFEPDASNMQKLREATWADHRILRFNHAVSDHFHQATFTSTGDYSAHLGGTGSRVTCCKLDDLWESSENHPTYIKMDIEGSEPEALWGARKLIKKYSPVLAICAYHTAEHLWELPLLIHALNPEYQLLLRRYTEGTWETVWYAVPRERVIK